MTFGEQTAERLEGYYPLFAEGVVDEIAEFAERQAGYKTYSKFLSDNYINLGEINLGKDRITHIKPDEFDEDEAIVVYLPMANSNDFNQLFQLATVVGTNPNTQVIAVANPSGPGNSSGRIRHDDRKSLIRGDARPYVLPAVEYIVNQGIERVHQSGFSWGADMATAVAKFQDFLIPHSILIEPASVVKREPLELLNAFRSTEGPMNDYVLASNLQTFLDARTDSKQLFDTLGFFKPTNLAIARFIMRGEFKAHSDYAHQKHDEMIATYVHGSESELAIDGLTRSITAFLREKFPGKVREANLIGQKHGMANDVHLHAALIRHGLSQAA